MWMVPGETDSIIAMVRSLIMLSYLLQALRVQILPSLQSQMNGSLPLLRWWCYEGPFEDASPYFLGHWVWFHPGFRLGNDLVPLSKSKELLDLCLDKSHKELERNTNREQFMPNVFTNGLSILKKNPENVPRCIERANQIKHTFVCFFKDRKLAMHFLDFELAYFSTTLLKFSSLQTDAIWRTPKIVLENINLMLCTVASWQRFIAPKRYYMT